MKKDRLLIIEDEAAVAKQLKWALGETYEITLAGEAHTARKLLAAGAFGVATLDLGLPPHPDSPREGLTLLEELPTLAPHTRVVVITGNSEQETALKAVALGAVDFCEKPIDLQILGIILSRTFRLQALEAANRELRQRTDTCGALCGMLGVSPVMQTLFELIRKVSASDYPVLVTGESGTGKEMVAHALHALSPRAAKPLVIVNCGAIPENLLESELFGHEKGAFTGAVGRKIGKFEQADGGTVFLDEIGELPLAMQVKLLRCLQEGTIERIGGSRPLTMDVRVVAATNVDLKAAVARGAFREDLYFRLNVVPLQLPSLRERAEDILLLAQHFLRSEAQAQKKGRVAFTSDALAALGAHPWPGNVRELQNLIRRALVTISSGWIGTADLGLENVRPETDEEPFTTLQAARERAERRCLRQALLLSGNNISQAAKLIETSRPTVHDLMKKHSSTV
ncbi:MAG TPA: PEP-CTERM-box response regulator transcription factor [Desulfobacterales bacterium]|nr:PEP-CTERM-box response regulator transcription factor [Desulfobacterales bacterium]